MFILKYQGHSSGLKMDRKDLQMHFALEEHIQTACLPSTPTERGDGYRQGENRDKEGESVQHSAAQH